MTFSYAEMTGRNIGFVSESEQNALAGASAFICGVGGMGGAAAQSLARAGVGRLIIADIDRFELSNLNRQVFATLGTLGQAKVDAVRDAIALINPSAHVDIYDADWREHLDEILARTSIVINGMDDIAAGITLYRKARRHGATVIDAYTSPLPSVTVVGPRAPRPEERLRFPSVGRDPSSLTRDELDACREAEILYVMASSSSADHIDLAIATDLLAGRRARPSFAPMVITTGNLMAFEAINLMLGRVSAVDHRGVFLNPWSFQVERPRGAVARWVRRRVARAAMRRLTAGPR
jgi:molybdopterin-synthase adenylyltransferase